MNLNDTTIGFIGAGNMATALIEGLLAQGLAAGQLWASDPDGAKLAVLAAKGLHTTGDNHTLVKACDIVVLAVKPQSMAQVLTALEPALRDDDCVLVSVAAGIRIATIAAATRSGLPIVRCMPNTPALVGEGATGLYANEWVSTEDKALVQGLLEAVGTACWLDSEEQIDAVTALSGSGPAYFFLLMEAMQDAAVQLGLPADIARSLTLQTAFGAAKLARASDVDVAELRRRVTSPNGTTEAAIRQFESEDLRAIVARALAKAAQRSQELSGR